MKKRKVYGKSAISKDLVAGALLSWMSFVNISNAGTFILVLPGQNIVGANTSIYCPFPANAGISARLVIRDGWLSL